MPTTDPLPELTLGPADLAGLRSLAEALRDSSPAPDHPEFFDRAWTSVGALPPALREFLEGFRRGEPAGACLVHGFPVDDEAVGPTPEHWARAEGGKSALDQEIFLALCGMALGEPFAWETLQSGRLIQNILPIPGDEARQNGYGSSTLLEFHTEDGFHPNRCDYLLLLGLRNHDRVPTIVASVRDVRLSAATRAVLAQERFCIVPDDEHIRQLELSRPDHPALTQMYRMKNHPVPTAVLFGSESAPYLRIDRPFMHCVGGDEVAEAALDELMDELQRVQQDVVVGPGTMLIVDNYLAVHGRKAFAVRYDGTDRWLKKITVSRNLRKGLVSHDGRSSRVIA